jgi:hypothetical protein
MGDNSVSWITLPKENQATLLMALAAGDEPTLSLQGRLPMNAIMAEAEGSNVESLHGYRPARTEQSQMSMPISDRAWTRSKRRIGGICKSRPKVKSSHLIQVNAGGLLFG